MVLVHECGHFLAAKLFGVRVEIFSIGFGPRLFGRRRGHTDYRLSTLPLGGYVKMAGDNPSAERAGAPDEFLSKPRWQRTLIVLAGPVTNILLAVLLLTGLYAVRYQKAAYLEEPARLAAVVPDSPAARAGLQPGDVVVELQGTENPTWEYVQVETVLAGKEPLTVTIARGEERFQRLIQPELEGPHQTGFVGWLPYDPLVVTEVQPDMPAAQAGLEVRDEIIALDGESTTLLGASHFVERIQASQESPVQLTVQRQARTLEFEVRPRRATWQGQPRYMLGIGIGPRLVSVRLGPVAAFKQSLADNGRFAGLLFEFLQRLFTGRASMRALEGPIGITVLSGQAAQLGLGSLLNLMAIISMNLAVLNLLPIPILDGGHIVFLAIEGARQRDLSLALKERVTQMGFMLLVLLFAVVMYNDILRYIFR